MDSHVDAGRFDVVVVGGGLVGNSLCIALSGTGQRVLQLEAQALASSAAADERKLALSATSLNALGALGVLTALDQPPEPLRRIHVSRVGGFGQVVLDAADYGRDRFGAVVRAGDLALALERRLSACADIHRWRPATLSALHESTDGVTLEVLHEGEMRAVRTVWLAGADGTKSAVREALGIRVDAHDYQQRLFVCTAQTDRRSDGTAFERFSDSGPLALLPMPGGVFGALCGVHESQANEIYALDDAAYAAYFQQRFGWRAGRIRKVGPRVSYPLRLVVAQRVDSARCVLLGNAAQTLHPIGAQGFNLGLRDALGLVECLQAHGDARDLPRRFATLREEDRQRTLAFSDGLARFTANDSSMASGLRQFGMLAAGLDPGLRAMIAAGAMGFRGTVPALARDRA